MIMHICCRPAGRLTPRGSLVGLAVDDIGTGGSSSGRSESPATTEGRNRKYRRSETDRCVCTGKIAGSAWWQ
jgi:hypothetical protein